MKINRIAFFKSYRSENQVMLKKKLKISKVKNSQNSLKFVLRWYLTNSISVKKIQ